MDHPSSGAQRPPRLQRGADSRPPTSGPGPRRAPTSPTSNVNNPNISFQEPEYSYSKGSPSPNDPRHNPRSPKSLPSPPTGDENLGFSDSDFRRKKSVLVRPERERIDPGHRQWHYRNHAAGIDEERNNSHGPRVDIAPSSTGNFPQTGGLRRGKSLLARDEDVHESGLALFKRGATLRRKRPVATGPTLSNAAGPGADGPPPKRGLFANIAPGPVDAWMIYCWVITSCVPPFLLQSCGFRTPEQQRAWREKMGLIVIISTLMAAVGFITFGFTQTVCGTPPTRFKAAAIDKGSVIIHGYDYDLSTFQHPAVGPFTGKSNPLFEGATPVGGTDLSFMFQYSDGNCRNVITAANGTTITQTNGLLDWMFPCNPYNQYGTSPVNITGSDNSTSCHTKSNTKASVNSYLSKARQGQVYYTWDQVTEDSRNLAVYESSVLDLNLLKWLQKSLVEYPPLFDDLMKGNGTFNKRDITMWIYRNNQKELARCLQDTVRVGFIDTKSIGCVASQVVLYVSLIFIIGVVAIRFGMAVIFSWFVSYKIGAFTRESYSQRMQRAAEIENWTDNIYRPAPSRYRPSVAPSVSVKNSGLKAPQFLPTTSRFSKADRPSTTFGLPEAPYRRTNTQSSFSSKGLSPSNITPSDPGFRNSRSSTSLPSFVDRNQPICPFPLHNVIPQPPPDYEPFNFPLAHTICLVTAYSESLEGLRTTLDSVATTDYPNSHKFLLVIADGMVKGSGNDMTTPDIVLSMMKELVVPVDEVESHSYVAIADGHKRHNMAKVYAGFYDYDDNTVEPSKQQRVPIVLVAKCGNPLEVSDPKPGNRGKRDSQMVLMAFLQKVMFDERMTTFEYEFFNSIWRCTGVSPDRYELVLCVDADTKVFPDSLTRMVSCFVHDEEIMGLCGETKIANKAETWVTMIQVFEYYISHHLTKAFESMFGGVTCLPGCFSMYRIKAPKGESGYWVPILANPDIVEHYSENIVDTLHKKNLLLLGEDRFLTTLMLKTFPKRKMIFCPQAVCKTIVPDTFSVLLSQRRRWINSTVHNLAELLLVRDLCGTFCFSMQFVVFMELTGTLVLPAAISFTLYLIISSIIPGGPDTTISLILLAIVLGLPGLLIVITSRKIAYVGWMLIYLLSLPIWNFVLPTYSFWHFDDFSWGQTRKVAGEESGNHGDKEGEFDSSHIVMKRWAEFERERRRGDFPSKESMYDVVHRTGSPKRADKRHSMGSSAETYHTDSFSNSRHSQQAMMSPASDETSQLVQPQPRNLAVPASYNSYRDSSPSNSSNGLDEPGLTPPGEYSPYDEHEPMMNARSPTTAYPVDPRRAYGYDQPQPSIPPPPQGYPSQPQSYSRSQTIPVFEEAPSSPVMPAQGLPRPSRTRQQQQRAPSRGVSLVDPGVISSNPEPVRRVPRKSRQGSTGVSSPGPASPASPPPAPGRPQAYPQSSLPPGAAPPQYRYG